MDERTDGRTYGQTNRLIELLVCDWKADARFTMFERIMKTQLKKLSQRLLVLIREQIFCSWFKPNSQRIFFWSLFFSQVSVLRFSVAPPLQTPGWPSRPLGWLSDPQVGPLAICQALWLTYQGWPPDPHDPTDPKACFQTLCTPLLSCCRSEKNPQYCHYVREILRPSGKHAFHIWKNSVRKILKKWFFLFLNLMVVVSVGRLGPCC